MYQLIDVRLTAKIYKFAFEYIKDEWFNLQFDDSINIVIEECLIKFYFDKKSITLDELTWVEIIVEDAQQDVVNRDY